MILLNYCLLSRLIITRFLVGVVMTSHPQRRHISVFRRKWKDILIYIQLRFFANTTERLGENNNSARSEACKIRVYDWLININTIGNNNNTTGLVLVYKQYLESLTSPVVLLFLAIVLLSLNQSQTRILLVRTSRRSVGNFPTAKNIVVCDGIEIFPGDCTYVLIQVRVAFSLIIMEGRGMGACQMSAQSVRMYASTKLAELS